MNGNGSDLVLLGGLLGLEMARNVEESKLCDFLLSQPGRGHGIQISRVKGQTVVYLSGNLKLPPGSDHFLIQVAGVAREMKLDTALVEGIRSIGEVADEGHYLWHNPMHKKTGESAPVEPATV